MKLRKTTGLVLGLVLASSLTACTSSTPNQGSSGPSTTQGDGSLEKIKKAGVLRVGGTPTGAPFTFLNPDSNKVEGIMVDLANRVGEKLGVKVEIVSTPFASLIPSLESDKIDMVSAGMYITDERKKVVAFNDPLFGWGEGLVVPASDKKSQTMADLTGKRVAAQSGTAYVKSWEDKGNKDVKQYKSVADMLTEMSIDRIDAFVADGPIIGYNILKNPQFKEKVRVVENYKPVAYGETSFGFRPADKELNAAVAKIASELKSSGEVKTTAAKWGLTLP